MLALAAGAFGIGTTEFVSMGLLNLIAADFQIGEDSAGRIISAYALGVVVGAPLITAVTGMIPRRRLLLLLMLAFTVGNGLSMLGENYHLLLVARFIAGLPHGAYFSVSGLAAASLAPEGQRGRAVAFIGLGLSVATVVGVPAAQALGEQLGWQFAYALVAAIGTGTLAALWRLMPHMTRMPATHPATELGALTNAQVWLTLAIGTVGFGGMFAIYTYITWTMTEHAGMRSDLVWLVLATYGIGMVFGNIVGGRLADRNLELGIAVSLVSIAVALLIFSVASSDPWLGTISFGVVGFCGSTLVPALQIRLMDVAGRAQTLAAALNHSALNAANASGAAIGGAVIACGLGYSAPALAGAALAVIGLGVWGPAYLLRRRALRCK